MNINTLLQQQRRSPPLPIKWLLLALLMLILMYTWQQRFFSAWVLIPFIFSVALLNKCLIVSKQHKRLKLIDELTIDPQFWQTFQREHPYIHISQRRLIEQGFKDYLALHVLVPQPYAMPSHAVDALWHVMLQYPDRYKKMSKSILGKRLSHNPYIGVQDHNVQKRQLMAAWKYSCLLIGSDPAYPQQLPRLFGIDQAMSWQNGQVYDLNTVQQEYRLYIKAQSSSDSSSGSSSCGSSCSSCGGGGD